MILTSELYRNDDGVEVWRIKRDDTTLVEDIASDHDVEAIKAELERVRVVFHTEAHELDPRSGPRSQHVRVAFADLSVEHDSYPRGGCLAAGTALLRNTMTGAAREVDLTSWASDSPEHVNYLLGLAVKHVGRS